MTGEIDWASRAPALMAEIRQKDARIDHLEILNMLLEEKGRRQAERVCSLEKERDHQHQLKDSVEQDLQHMGDDNARLRQALRTIVSGVVDRNRPGDFEWQYKLIADDVLKLARQISNVPASAASSAEASTETGRTGRPLSKPDPEMAASSSKLEPARMPEVGGIESSLAASTTVQDIHERVNAHQVAMESVQDCTHDFEAIGIDQYGPRVLCRKCGYQAIQSAQATSASACSVCGLPLGHHALSDHTFSEIKQTEPDTVNDVQDRSDQ